MMIADLVMRRGFRNNDLKPSRPRCHLIDLIETGSYENIGRRFLAVNPAGLVPVLVHQGQPIYESHEIIAYLARETQSGRELVPSSEIGRELMQRWVDRASLVGDDPTDGLDNSAANCVAVLSTPLFCAVVKVTPVHLILERLLFHRLRFRPLLFLLLKRILTGGVHIRSYVFINQF